MTDKKTGYKDWQWLEMEADEARLAQSLCTAFNAAVNRDGTTGFALEIDRARLTIGREEAFSGAGHQLADGKPFYRLTLRAPDQQQGMALFLLAQHFATAGGAQMSLGEKPELTLDRRDFLSTALALKTLTPQAIDALRR